MTLEDMIAELEEFYESAGFEDYYDYNYKMVYIKVKGNKDEISCYVIFRANCKWSYK